MRNPSNLKRKIVRDPHQRTITGRIVHILWLFVAAAIFVTATLGVAGGVAARRVLDKGVAYLEEVRQRDETHFSLNGMRLNQSSFIYAKNPKTGSYILKIKVRAAGTNLYKAKTTTVKVKIQVR